MDLCDIHHNHQIPLLIWEADKCLVVNAEGRAREIAPCLSWRESRFSRGVKIPPFENREGRGIPLLKHDLLKQFRTDDFAYLLAFFCALLSLLFAAHDLVTHRFAFGGQAVHGSVILVFDRKSKVPILRATVCFFEEDLVIDDRSRTFFLLE